MWQSIPLPRLLPAQGEGSLYGAMRVCRRLSCQSDESLGMASGQMIHRVHFWWTVAALHRLVLEDAQRGMVFSLAPAPREHTGW